jgi:hypothetical protein
MVPPVPAAQMKPSTRRAAMPLSIRHVVELIRPDRALRRRRREFVRQTMRNVNVVPGVFVGLRGDLTQIRATESKHVLLLLALRVRDHDHGSIAASVRHERETDPGIAGRPLDDRATGLE